jgi:hypothetical protein
MAQILKKNDNFVWKTGFLTISRKLRMEKNLNFFSDLTAPLANRREIFSVMR